MFNQHPTNFLELVRAYSKHYPINLRIINMEDNQTYKLTNDSSSTDLIIIYDPRYKKSPLDYPENYYCNTFDELLTLVKFMKKKHRLYETETL